MTATFRAVVFADGGEIWVRSVRRLERELNSSGLFSKVEIYNSTRIRQELPEFWFRNHSFITSNKRGFGYWIWKPAIILHALGLLGETEEGVLYIDAGSSINYKTQSARMRFEEYKSMALQSGGLLFRLRGKNSHESWTKASALKKFQGVPVDLKSNLLVGGAIFVSKDWQSRELVETWGNLLESENYSLLDDSVEKESPLFVEHRHDQSLLSLIAEASEWKIIDDETYFDNDWFTVGLNYPIWSTRLRSGFKYRGDSFVQLAIRKVERIFFGLLDGPRK